MSWHWTEEQLETARAMKEAGARTVDIAAAVGRDWKSVDYKLRALGYDMSKPNPWSIPALRDRAEEMLREGGRTAKEIAAVLLQEFDTVVPLQRIYDLKQVVKRDIAAQSVEVKAEPEPAPPPVKEKTEVRYRGLVIPVTRIDIRYVRDTTSKVMTTRIALPKLSMFEGAGA